MQHNCILGLIFYTSELQELNAKINLIPITPHILLNGTVIFRPPPYQLEQAEYIQSVLFYIP